MQGEVAVLDRTFWTASLPRGRPRSAPTSTTLTVAAKPSAGRDGLGGIDIIVNNAGIIAPTASRSSAGTLRACSRNLVGTLLTQAGCSLKRSAVGDRQRRLHRRGVAAVCSAGRTMRKGR
jgi:NAD(P)-dependent dehydrogenase (short-subunit alcohol dehydrogenase family)